MKFFLAIFVAFFVVAFAAPSPPVISEIFSASTSVDVEVRNQTVFSGEGLWIVSQPHGKALESMRFDRGRVEENIYRLDRFDLGRSYEIFEHNGVNTTCIERQEHGLFQPIWEWVKTATYSTKQIGGVTYDYWSFTRGYATIAIAVLPSAPNTPVYYIAEGPERINTVKFLSWSTSPPREAHFDIPTTCKKVEEESENKRCEARSTMISRAQSWVNARVPYSQTHTHGGYREDCSGYVSMMWETSKPGYTTFTMHDIAHPISKSQLAPGDILLCRTEHVVIFGGWESGKSKFIAFEETRPGEGTVRRVTPYPYWYNTGCFKPYRYNHVC